MYKYLSNITPDVGLIFLQDHELTPKVRELLVYLTNGSNLDDLLKGERFPKYIFTEQFNQQVLITINNNDQKIDQFSKSFTKERRVLRYKELVTE